MHQKLIFVNNFCKLSETEVGKQSFIISHYKIKRHAIRNSASNKRATRQY